MSQKQEKQGKTRKKQAKTRSEQEYIQQNKSIGKPITLEEAKREVFNLIQQGVNYREITKSLFNIQGLGKKRFSISEISKIKSELQDGSRDTTSNNSKPHKSEIFRLIKKGTSLEDIVITLGLEPNIVKETYNEYEDLVNSSKLPAHYVYETLESKGIELNDLESFRKKIGRLAESYSIFNLLHFRCAVCKKPISLSPYGNSKDWLNNLLHAITFLSENYVHNECFY